MQGENNKGDQKRDVVTETGSKRFYVAGCEDAGRGPRTKKCGQSLKIGKSKEMIFP